MWEIFSDGEEPYKGITNLNLVEYLKVDKQRLKKPSLCEDEIYNDWMTPCWELVPKKRYLFIHSFSTILGARCLKSFQRLNQN